MNGNCWLPWRHDWEKWEVTDRGDRMHFPRFREGDEYSVGKFLIQQRSCKKCGKMQINTQKS